MVAMLCKSMPAYFFLSSGRRHTRFVCDWSSDVCSSDLYMFRLIGLTFWGESRVDPAVEPHVHESPAVMTTPLWILAIPTVLLGLVLSLPGPPLGPLLDRKSVV